MVNVNDKAGVHQTILEISKATTAEVTQSDTFVAFVIEGSISTWDESINVSGTSDSGQLGLREQGPKMAEHESRTRKHCFNHQEQSRTGLGKVIVRRR